MEHKGRLDMVPPFDLRKLHLKTTAVCANKYDKGYNSSMRKINKEAEKVSDWWGWIWGGVPPEDKLYQLT